MNTWPRGERRAGVSIAGRYRLPEPWAVCQVGRRRRAVRPGPTAPPVDDQAAAIARLEAVLWIAREPLGSRRLAQLATLADGTQARTLVRMLNRHYDQHGCAFRAEEVAGGFQLMTRRQFAPWLRRLHTEPVDVRLSAPALETLAVVAYRQPVLRADVEAVRGVQCGEILRQLIERDLVRVLRRSDELGRPLLYGTTKHFLQVFGLKSLEELPRPASLAAATNQQNANQSADESVQGEAVDVSSEVAGQSRDLEQLNSQQGEDPDVNALVQPTAQSLYDDETALVESQMAQADLPGDFDEEAEFEDEFEEEEFDDEDDFDDDEGDDEDDEDWEDDDDFDDLDEEDDEEPEDDGDLEDEPWEEVEDDDSEEEDDDEDDLDEDDDEDWEDEDDEDWDEDDEDWDEDDEDWGEGEEDEEDED